MFYLIDTAMDYVPQFDAVIAIISGGFSRIFSRFHWAALLSAVALATFCWWTQRKAMPPQCRPGLLAWMFPRSIWLHRSALLDYRFVLFDKFMIAMLAAIGAMLFLQPGSEAKQFLSSPGPNPSLTILLAYTLALLVVEDFCRYWAHRIMHMSPLLWQFHKVHHSPEVLVPFSQMRSHPVNGIVNLLRSGIAIGSVTGVFLLLFPGKLTVLSIFGVNAGRFVFDVMGSNLRHSHV